MNLLALTARIERDKALYHYATGIHANAILVSSVDKLSLIEHETFKSTVANLLVIESPDVTTHVLVHIDEVPLRALAHANA